MLEPDQVDVTKAVPMAPPPPEKDRQTALLHVYHEHRGSEPMGADIRTHRVLLNKEQPVRRRIAVDGTAKALEIFWLQEYQCGLVVIENHSQTEDVLLPDWVIPPKGFHAGTPEDIAKLTVRTRGNPCEITYYIFPR